MSEEIIIRVEGHAGRITLNRPQVLNALSFTQVHAMTDALNAWRNDGKVKLVLVDALGDRAFCAGGDIQALYHGARKNPKEGETYWRDEYDLNAMIRLYPKPYVAIMDGIVMGGGVGISAHGSHRIVTERSTVTMPETGIGFLPDVGGTRLLADAPGHVGYYLGITATRMSPADAIYAGFADSFVSSDKLAALKDALKAGDVGVIQQFAGSPPPSKLAEHRAVIDRHFALPSVAAIAAALEKGTSDFERETLATLRRISPFAACVTFAALNKARESKRLEPCLNTEYRFGYRCLHGFNPDLWEGIRAAVIDKDRNPKWMNARIEDVDLARVAEALAPLGANDWRQNP